MNLLDKLSTINKPIGMDKAQRNRTTAIIKHCNQQYLSLVKNEIYYSRLEKRFANLARKTRSLTRKDYGSERSLAELSSLGRLVSGFMENLKQKKAPDFDFVEYKKVLNEYLIKYLDAKRKTNYNNQCASYGETLFVLYLDLFITATINKTDRKIQANPSFLVNPKTGSTLEIDVLFEDFKLAFEFQGEHHYTEPKTQEKDLFKLSECRKRGVILIPVNISQLNSSLLQSLIVNSIKDFLGIHDLFTSDRAEFAPKKPVNSKQLLNICKITERLYTSTVIFDSCAIWFDGLANRYIEKIQNRSPISSTSSAPRQTPPTEDFDIASLHRSLKHVAIFRKKKSSSTK